MILLDREKDSAVNSTRSGRYRGLASRRAEEESGIIYCVLDFSYLNHFFRCAPVVNGTGYKVCVEDSDDGRCCVSQNGIINNIQEVDQL